MKTDDLAWALAALREDLSVTKRALEFAEKERDEARAIIAQHDLCHNQHGKVDARAFADDCAAEQRNLYGYAPDADEVQRLRDEVKSLKEQLQKEREDWSRT